LGFATKQIKMGRFSKYGAIRRRPRLAEYKTEKFGNKLLGEDNIKAILGRLDRLTQEEARISVTQTLEIVHGLVSNMKVVMDGVLELTVLSLS
jgi:hypothetical protein